MSTIDPPPERLDGFSFVADLVAEMERLFAQLGATETLIATSDEALEIVPLLKLALKSELEAAEIAAYWLPTTPEIDAKTVLSEQCADELRHYNLIVARLAELGENLTDFDPREGGYSPLFRYLRGLRTTIERIAAGPFACEAVAEVRNRQFIELCLAAGDEKTAELYERIIHPEEIHHHRRGREILEKYATTSEAQALCAAATRSSLAIADELQILIEKSTGLHAMPFS